MSRFRRRLADGRTATLVALGDSLTVGYLVGRGYFDYTVAALRERFPHSTLHAHNEGVCGDTVLDGLRRAERALFARMPDLALIQFGLNDCFQGDSPIRFQQDLGTLLDALADRLPECEVLLVPAPPVALPEFDAAAQPFRMAMQEEAERRGLLLAPVHETFRQEEAHAPLWLDDGVHPTQAGYRGILAAVMTALDLSDLRPIF